jgi:ubiquinone/menaquinone biosynthesis C-methylase UbiE
MNPTLVVQENKAKYDEVYKKGYDKRYPNLDLVRLERWYLKGKPGRLLEYGFGTGTNLIHMLECGYDCDAVEVSGEALKLTERKLASRPELAARARLALLEPGASRLPYPDESFDYALCINVLSLLGTRERVVALVKEFQRVLKRGGRAIIDVNGPASDFSVHATKIAPDTYEYRGNDGKGHPSLCFCPQTEGSFREVLAGFEIEDLGFSSFKYAKNESFEYIACLRKP